MYIPSKTADYLITPEEKSEPSGDNVRDHCDEEKQKRATLRPRNKRSIIKDWSFELGALVAACFSFAAIFGILVRFHDERLDDWTEKYTFNLSTIVAVLSTCLRALLILIAEEVISQFKWVWQLRSRPVIHLDRIDEASRGLFGSLKLFRHIFTYKINVVYLGCLVMILGVAVGPFSQQAAGTKTCDKPIRGVKAKIPYTYTGVRYGREAAGLWRPEPGVQGRIAQACSDPKIRNSTFLVEGCSTGNCTFPTTPQGSSLSTLGVCSKCIDTSRHLQKTQMSNGIHNISLPNGLSLSPNARWGALAVSSQGDLEWARSSFDDAFSAALSGHVANITVIGTTLSQCQYTNSTAPIETCDKPPSIEFEVDDLFPAPQNLFSTSCTLYSCTRHHTVRIERGTLLETVISDVPAFSDGNLPPSGLHYFLRPTCQIGTETIDLTKARILSLPTSEKADFQVRTGGADGKIISFSGSDNCTADVSMLSIWALRLALEVLDGNCEFFMSSRPARLQERNEWIKCEPWPLFGLMNNGFATFESTSATFAAIADTITDRVRELAVREHFRDTGPGQSETNVTSGGYIEGDVMQTTVCTEFRWPWLLWPASVLLMTAISLLNAVFRSYKERLREPLWKSSLLPALYAVQGSKLQADGGHSLKELRAVAQRHHVKLVKKEDGRWDLIRQKPEDTGDEIGERVSLIVESSRP